MNKILPLILIVFVVLGCNMIDRLSKQEPPVITNAPTPESTKEFPTKDSSNASGDEGKDLLSFGSGAYLASISSEYTPGEVSRWSAFGLIDESKKIGWASKTTKVTNQSIVFELPAKTTLDTIGFDTEGVDTTGSAAKDVSVEISDASANDGFESILSVTLEDKTDGQDFKVEKKVAGRWVRINATNNYGSDQWLEIMEVRGYGKQENIERLEDVSGTYDTGRWGKFHIKQEGTSIVGCYEFNEGLLDGGIDGKVMTLNWLEKGGTEKSRGPAVFLFADEANEFVGLWGYSDADYYSGKWDGKKISDEVGDCAHFKELSGTDAIQNQLEEKLEKDGRAAVYGINFDFNSDKIKDESKQAIDQIVGVLKENADWKMTVEGHTDNIGGEAFNQTLSEKRANAVKTYLVNAGIDEMRLTAKGVGMSKPIAKNDTEAGRARNRRVELVKE